MGPTYLHSGLHVLLLLTHQQGQRKVCRRLPAKGDDNTDSDSTLKRDVPASTLGLNTVTGNLYASAIPVTVVILSAVHGEYVVRLSNLQTC